MNVLIGCTGSVASIKIPELVECIKKLDNEVEVKVVATSKATHFFDVKSVSVPVLLDENEWSTWQQRGDPVLHIDLRRWADILVIAPLDANTLAKLAAGICDNLLTCIVRAWDMSKPLLFAPAMNTLMWEHPLTVRHITQLRELGYREIPCVEKTLMCGDKGLGAMASVDTIVDYVRERATVSKKEAATTETSSN